MLRAWRILAAAAGQEGHLPTLNFWLSENCQKKENCHPEMQNLWLEHWTKFKDKIEFWSLMSLPSGSCNIRNLHCLTESCYFLSCLHSLSFSFPCQFPFLFPLPSIPFLLLSLPFPLPFSFFLSFPSSFLFLFSFFHLSFRVHIRHPIFEAPYLHNGARWCMVTMDLL